MRGLYAEKANPSTISQASSKGKGSPRTYSQRLMCPIIPTTFGGMKDYVLFINDYTRMMFIYPLKGKTSGEVLERFKEYKAKAEKHTGKEIKRLRTDGGGKYQMWVSVYLKQVGIIHEMTAPYSLDQNGIAERANRMIMEKVKAIIAEYELNKRL